MPRDEYLGTGSHQGHDIERCEHKKRETTGEERQDRRHDHRNRHTYTYLGCSVHGRSGLRPDRLAWRPGCGQPGGKVGSERGQFRIGPRCERPAHPPIQLVLGQPSLHKRGLQHADHVLAVGVRRPQMPAARFTCCHLVPRPALAPRHRKCKKSVVRAPTGSHPASPSACGRLAEPGPSGRCRRSHPWAPVTRMILRTG
jgi:hypothetical protein